MDCFGRPDGHRDFPRNDKLRIVCGSRMAAAGKRIQIAKLICRHPASYTESRFVIARDEGAKQSLS